MVARRSAHALLLAAAASAALAASSASTAAASTTTARSTWEEEAEITDASTECTYYSFAAVDDVADYYPTIWATAALNFTGVLQSDIDVYNAFKDGIPDIAPKGTKDGDFSSVSYNSTDPDCWWTWDKCTTPKLDGLASDITECPEPNTWGFTLDDGPNCSHNAYYDYLQEQDQKATMFFIGSNVMDWPLEAQRALGDGHEICVHTWSHPYMTAMTNEEAFAELYFTKKAIHDVLGITVNCWRPPYGDVDDRIRYIANKLNLTNIIWSDDTDDWDYTAVGVADVELNYEAIINKTANNSFATYGPIVLTHELDNETMSLSKQFLPSIQEKFTGGVMPVGVCMNWTQPYSEGAAYQYPNYAQWAAGTRSISLAAPTAYTSEIPLATSSVVSSAGAASASATASGSSTKSSSKTTKSGSSGVSTATSAADAASTSSTTSGANALKAGLGLAGAAAVGAMLVV